MDNPSGVGGSISLLLFAYLDRSFSIYTDGGSSSLLNKRREEGPPVTPLNKFMKVPPPSLSRGTHTHTLRLALSSDNTTW